MKKLFFLCAMLAVGLYVQAQQLEVCTKPYGNDGSEMTVIKPTVANFLTLLAMNEEQFKEFMSQVHARQCYDTGIDAEYGDQLITLSTCEYTYNNGRFVVVAKKV